MIQIIKPEQFKTIPWKNGQGQTTELAISPGGTLTDFDWRLSIARVNENGAFSDFSGYDRQLILLSGNGITLTHDEKCTDELSHPLSVAKFDGGSRTVGTLVDGPIKDFNVMTKQHKFKAEVATYIQPQTISCITTALSFIYAAQQSIQIQTKQNDFELTQGYLLQVFNETELNLKASGQGFIVVTLQLH